MQKHVTVFPVEPLVRLHKNEQLVIGKLALRGVCYIVLLVNFRPKENK